MHYVVWHISESKLREIQTQLEAIKRRLLTKIENLQSKTPNGMVQHCIPIPPPVRNLHILYKHRIFQTRSSQGPGSLNIKIDKFHKILTQLPTFRNQPVVLTEMWSSVKFSSSLPKEKKRKYWGISRMWV